MIVSDGGADALLLRTNNPLLSLREGLLLQDKEDRYCWESGWLPGFVLPVSGVADLSGGDVEGSAEAFDQSVGTLDLVVGGGGGSLADDADTDDTVPVGGELSVPLG